MNFRTFWDSLSEPQQVAIRFAAIVAAFLVASYIDGHWPIY